MNDSKFQTEVLQRLAILETLIKEQDYKGTSKIADEANTRSLKNEKEIEELKEKNKWYYRTIVAAFLVGIIGIILTIFKSGIGMN